MQTGAFVLEAAFVLGVVTAKRPPTPGFRNRFRGNSRGWVQIASPWDPSEAVPGEGWGCCPQGVIQKVSAGVSPGQAPPTPCLVRGSPGGTQGFHPSPGRQQRLHGRAVMCHSSRTSLEQPKLPVQFPGKRPPFQCSIATRGWWLHTGRHRCRPFPLSQKFFWTGDP